MPLPSDIITSNEHFTDTWLDTHTKGDLSYIRDHLPDHYKVSVIKIAMGVTTVRCISRIGMDDGRKEEEWEAFKMKIRLHFKNRFREIFHNTCCRHMDFNIYLQQ